MQGHVYITGTIEGIQQRVSPSAWDQVADNSLGDRPVSTLYKSKVRNGEVKVDTELKGKVIRLLEARKIRSQI